MNKEIATTIAVLNITLMVLYVGVGVKCKTGFRAELVHLYIIVCRIGLVKPIMYLYLVRYVMYCKLM